MNGQVKRLVIARDIIVACGIRQIIETGTYLGTTTAFFGDFRLPVVTVERDKDLAEDAVERLKPWPNVRVINNDSRRALRQLLADGIDRESPTFFYLDAHAGRHLPVHEELSLMCNYFQHAVAMIDDFNVPDDPGYGFSGEARLSLRFLLQGSLSRLIAFFPRARSSEETGARRGTVVLSADDAIVAALARIEGLRRWHGG